MVWLSVLIAANAFLLRFFFNVAGFQSCCRAFQWPAFSASIVLLVPPERLDRANGLREFADGISQLIVCTLFYLYRY